MFSVLPPGCSCLLTLCSSCASPLQRVHEHRGGLTPEPRICQAARHQLLDDWLGTQQRIHSGVGLLPRLQQRIDITRETSNTQKHRLSTLQTAVNLQI